MRIKLTWGRPLECSSLSDINQRSATSKDCILEKFIVYIMNLNLIVALVGSLSSLMNGAESYMALYRVTYYGSIVLFFLYCCYDVYKKQKINKGVLLVTVSSTCIMVISIMTLPDFSDSLPEALPAFCFFIALSTPMFILASRITNWNELLFLSRPYIILSLVFSVVVLAFPVSTDMEYNMISGALIVPTISAMVCFFIRNDKWAGLIFVVNATTIFLKGSRAPLLGIIGGFIVVFLFSIKRISVKRCVIFSIVFFVLICAVVFRTQLIGLLSNQFPDSRTIYLLSNISNAQLFQTGRSEIQECVMSLISQKPVTGYGPFGASYYLSHELGLPVLQQGVYAHSLPLDLILQYGCVLGGILIISLFMGGIYAISRAIHDIGLVFIVAIIIGNFLQLMVSGSYIDDKIFWLSIGFLLSKYRPHNDVITVSEGTQT